eukprot:gene5103-34903_t
MAPKRPRESEVSLPGGGEASPVGVESSKLKIGIVGFGTFGQFLAKRFTERGHTVLAYNARRNYQAEADKLGAAYFKNADDFCEEHPEIVILCTSILSTRSVVAALPVQRLRRSTLFVDVLSVKTFPKMLLQEMLPAEVDVLCTHPMFGPNSGAGSWDKLNFMYDKVRIASDRSRQNRVDAFLNVFRDEGCNMVEMTCEEHDRQAASTQFVTHTVGRMLGAMQLERTPIDTKGYEALHQLVEQTTADSFDLYYGLFLYNKNAVEELEKMEEAFDSVKKQLFSRLHGIARMRRDEVCLHQSKPTSSPDRGQQHGGQLHSAGASAVRRAQVRAPFGSHGLLSWPQRHAYPDCIVLKRPVVNLRFIQ